MKTIVVSLILILTCSLGKKNLCAQVADSTMYKYNPYKISSDPQIGTSEIADSSNNNSGEPNISTTNGLNRKHVQSSDSAKLQHNQFQVTFVTPAGTNGINSGNITNNFSINFLAGYNGGLSGIEFGGFSNTLKNDMHGTQIAGFSNTVLGKSTGCQISGFSNFTRKTFNGAQIAGISNIICDSSRVFQAAGILNFVNGKTTGFQGSGFVNIVNGDIRATQVAGHSNISLGTVKGSQIAGLFNLSKGSVKGSQIAGIANIALNDINGIQIGGVFNYTKKLKGVQLGLINKADTVEKGIPIGFLSIVKHGYKSVELSANETLFLTGSYITGVKQFYNIFTIGARPGSNIQCISLGYGIGSNLELGKWFDVGFELSTHQIILDDWDFEKLNSLNKAKMNIFLNLGKNLSIFGGVSYNVFVTDETNSEGELTNSGIVPWSNFSTIEHDYLVEMYPGFNFGIRIQ